MATLTSADVTCEAARAEKTKAAPAERKAGSGPLDRLAEARRRVEVLGAERREASSAVRRRAEDLRRFERADEWTEAQAARGELPGLQKKAAKAEEALREAEAELAALEAEARRFLVERYRPAFEEVVAAAEKFLLAAESDREARILARTAGADLSERALPWPPPAQAVHALKTWLEGARERAGIVFGSAE